MASWPSDLDGMEADIGLLMDKHDAVNQITAVEVDDDTSVGHEGGMIDTAVEQSSTEEHNETWITTEIVSSTHSGIMSTKLNLTYTAAAEVISVLE